MKPWLTLGASVTAIDLWLAYYGRQTLSCEFREAYKLHPVLVTAGATYVLAHLYGVLPHRVDILKMGATAIPLKDRSK